MAKCKTYSTVVQYKVKTSNVIFIVFNEENCNDEEYSTNKVGAGTAPILDFYDQ